MFFFSFFHFSCIIFIYFSLVYFFFEFKFHNISQRSLVSETKKELEVGGGVETRKAWEITRTRQDKNKNKNKTRTRPEQDKIKQEQDKN